MGKYLLGRRALGSIGRFHEDAALQGNSMDALFLASVVDMARAVGRLPPDREELQSHERALGLVMVHTQDTVLLEARHQRMEIQDDVQFITKDVTLKPDRQLVVKEKAMPPPQEPMELQAWMRRVEVTVSGEDADEESIVPGEHLGAAEDGHVSSATSITTTTSTPTYRSPDPKADRTSIGIQVDKTNLGQSSEMSWPRQSVPSSQPLLGPRWRRGHAFRRVGPWGRDLNGTMGSASCRCLLGQPGNLVDRCGHGGDRSPIDGPDVSTLESPMSRERAQHGDGRRQGDEDVTMLTVTVACRRRIEMIDRSSQLTVAGRET
ncbi:hypothetical protein QBC39DRAFT_437973 [Podospora conica]|nr:hypothetical protein QBC39DRAFT_437973 [Schizothecium conicum]